MGGLGLVINIAYMLFHTYIYGMNQVTNKGAASLDPPNNILPTIFINISWYIFKLSILITVT